MLYLLDTNVLIDANRDYYPLKRIPEFWEWLVYLGSEGVVKIPVEMYEEIKVGRDDDVLSIWAKQIEVESSLLLDEEVEEELVSRIVSEGYSSDLTDDEINTLGRDPFLLAYALKDKTNRCIITTEISKPSKTRANKHLPDVSSYFGIPTYNTFKFVEKLNFSTKWKSNQ